MPSFRRTVVAEVLSARDGLQRVRTELGPAYVLTDLIGWVAVGDPVVVNTTAVELGLGTGGWHVVHWNLARDEWVAPGPGHIMKLRYTSLQVDTGAVEELEAGALAEADDLAGLPVVACGLHSQVPCVAAAVKHAAPEARIAYVMTDGAALPLALSDLVVAMRAAGLVDVTFTAGNAFGGDHEAVNVASALVAARVVAGADIAIVAMGPGVVGTATELGYSALEVAGVLDIAERLGGRPVACLRYSDVDPRLRHQGVSHHTLTALRLTGARAAIGVLGDRSVAIDERHRVVTVDDVDVPGLLERAGVVVTTMGRGPDDDPAFFAFAGAAGTVAAGMLRP